MMDHLTWRSHLPMRKAHAVRPTRSSTRAFMVRWRAISPSDMPTGDFRKLSILSDSTMKEVGTRGMLRIAAWRPATDLFMSSTARRIFASAEFGEKLSSENIAARSPWKKKCGCGLAGRCERPASHHHRASRARGQLGLSRFSQFLFRLHRFVERPDQTEPRRQWQSAEKEKRYEQY